MSRNVRYALIVLVAILVWLFSGVFGRDDKSKEEVEQTQLTGVEVLRSSAVLRRPSISFNARTEPFRFIDLRAETSGPLVSAEVPEGSQVQSGAIVGKIDVETRALRVTEARSLLEQAQLEYKGALELKAKGLLSDAEIARNKSSVDSAKAALNAAEIELGRVEIEVPFDGVLNDRFFEVGDYIQQGQVFAEFLQLDPLKAVFYVSEKEVIELDPAESLQLVLSGGRKLEGELLFKSVKADSQSRTFKVEAVFSNPDNEILADLTGRISVSLKPVQTHAVPAALLSLNTEGELSIKTLNTDKTVNSYPVNIITDDKDSVWVTGLPEKADVIVAGYEYVGVGEQVSVVWKNESPEGFGIAENTIADVAGPSAIPPSNSAIDE